MTVLSNAGLRIVTHVLLTLLALLGRCALSGATSSLLDDAEIIGTNQNTPISNSLNVLGPSFKSAAKFRVLEEGTTFPVEAMIDFGQERTIHTVFVLPRIHLGLEDLISFAGAKIYIGNSDASFSDNLTAVTDELTAGGFKVLTEPTTGQYLVIRRDTATAQQFGDYMALTMIKVYEEPNIL